MKILLLTVDIEEKSRGIGTILKNLIIAAKNDGHEVGILAGHPFLQTDVSEYLIKRKLDHLYLQHYLIEGRDSFKYLIPGGYRKRNLLKRLLAGDILKHRESKIDSTMLSGHNTLARNLDFFIQIPFVYQFIARNKTNLVRKTLKSACKQYGIDLVVCVSPALLKAKDIRPAKLVQFIHDAMPFELIETPPDNDTPFRYAKQFITASKYSDAVWVNSEDTKQKVDSVEGHVKSTVLYGGVSSAPKEVSDSAILNNLGLKKNKYLLFVSAIEKRKNIESLLEAYSLSYDEIGQIPLVLVGGKGYGYSEIMKKYKSLPDNVKNNVIFTGYVSESDKSTLYKNANSFVFPSVYEGLGVILLESFQYNLPVLTSSKGALHEAGGDAVLYIDNPYDVSEIANNIIRIVNDKELRKSLAEKMPVQLSKFSTDKFTERVHLAISEIKK